VTTNLFLIPAAIVYLLVVTALYAYGLNFYYLTFLALKKVNGVSQELPPLTDWPLVTIQLPIYNELYVAQRVIEAAASVDYPLDKLEIQVLDDSNDETVSLVVQTVERLKAGGIDIIHVTRLQRDGFKAGALRDGLKSAKGDFIAIFDADFLPGQDFLRRTIPCFQNEQIAFVQARWDHANRDYSSLTLIQALSIDGHFMVEQFSRSAGGYWFNFNGTAGVWRKTAIEDAGGWQPRTLTEDLDLSYRAFLRGWHARYLYDLAVPAEIPPTFSAYRRQQHRWARGSLENAGILLPKIWQSDFPLKLKLEATLHLTGYAVHLLLFALTIIYPLVVGLSSQLPALVSLFGIALLFNMTALAPTLFFVVAQIRLKRRWWTLLPPIVFISVFGSGMMLNTVRAALEIFMVKNRSFERTPKHGITSRGESWRKSHYRIKLDPIIFWEMAWGVLNVGSCILAFGAQHWFISFYTLLFAVGLFYNSFYSLAQSIDVAPS
jgi:cellulose synthase/poly-beta-1,6-N-acetylglucosamine synthase-like glycosyltransferase